jgi:hypothetical protein
MLSISRSRYRFLVQFIFFVTNAVGVLLAIIYNTSTPDLYPNNAHHKLGWILTWIVGAQVLLGMVSAYAGRKRQNNHTERASFIPISQEAIVEHKINDLEFQDDCRFSGDSGHGTEPNTVSSRNHSVSSAGSDHLPLPESRNDLSEGVVEEEVHVLYGRKLEHFLFSRISGSLSFGLLRAVRLLYDFTDCYILLLAWAGFLTGWVTYGGFFVSMSDLLILTRKTNVGRRIDGKTNL